VKSRNAYIEHASLEGKEVLKNRIRDLCLKEGWTCNKKTQNNLVEFCWIRIEEDEKNLFKCTQSFLFQSFARFKAIYPCEDWNTIKHAADRKGELRSGLEPTADAEDAQFPLNRESETDDTATTMANNKKRKHPSLACDECLCKGGVHISTYGANNPNEDRHAFRVGVQLSKNSVGHFFAVIDGHGGDTCAEYARQELIQRVINKLHAHSTAIDTFCETLTSSDSDVKHEELDDLEQNHLEQNIILTHLKEAFHDLDDEWFDKIGPNNGVMNDKQNCPEKNGQWSVGCCVFLAMILQTEIHLNQYNKSSGGNSRFLFTAHCGDVRACLLDRSKPAIRLTEDHTASNKKEASYVRNLSCDRCPIRKGKDGTDTLKVAGCLVPTRAIGDAFLKRSQFSFDPFKRKCPYITCHPDVSMKTIDSENHTYLIIATDGIWENVSEDAVNEWVNMNSKKQVGSSNSPTLSQAGRIIAETLNVVCKLQGMKPNFVHAVPKGRQRRNIHDDMTVVVVDLQREIC